VRYLGHTLISPLLVAVFLGHATFLHLRCFCLPSQLMVFIATDVLVEIALSNWYYCLVVMLATTSAVITGKCYTSIISLLNIKWHLDVSYSF